MDKQIILTPQQIAIVKKSWSLIRNIDPVFFGEVFYRKLFIDLPEVKKLFTTARNEQSAKLLAMLNMIVMRLDRPDEISTEIRQLGIRHSAYGVKEEYYEYVGNAIIWTLKQALRAEWTDEMETAWSTCYRFLSETMINAVKDHELKTGNRQNSKRAG